MHWFDTSGISPWFGEPFVVTWHVANVTNLIISTESATGANIEVRHAKNEGSTIMDRSGTRTSVILCWTAN